MMERWRSPIPIISYNSAKRNVQKGQTLLHVLMAKYSVNGSMSGQLYMERVRKGTAYVWAVSLVDGQVAFERVHEIDYSGTGTGEMAVVGDLAAYNNEHEIVDLEMGKLGD